jgi:hypothetical protein
VERRAWQRNDLIQTTEEQLRELERKAQTRKQPVAIGTRVARVVNRRGVGKLFRITLGEHRFEWSRNQDAIAAEEQLDGIYVIRTSEPASAYPADALVRRYKSLSQVERAFRCLKGIDLLGIGKSISRSTPRRVRFRASRTFSYARRRF